MKNKIEKEFVLKVNKTDLSRQTFFATIIAKSKKDALQQFKNTYGSENLKITGVYKEVKNV